MKFFNRKPQNSQAPEIKRYQVHYNADNDIEVCNLVTMGEDEIATTLVGIFANTAQYAEWQRANAITAQQCVWGTPNANADFEMTRVWGL